MKKISIISVALLVGLTGCFTQEVSETSADTGTMQVEPIEKVLTASDVRVDSEYIFAYSDTVVSGYDTYDNSMGLHVQSEDQAYTLYGSNEEPTDISDMEVISEVSEADYTVTDNYVYYGISSDSPIDVVVAVN